MFNDIKFRKDLYCEKKLLNKFNQGDLESQYQLGLFYYNKKDYKNSIEYLCNSLNAGHALPSYDLDFLEQELITIALNNDPEAQYQLGFLYSKRKASSKKTFLEDENIKNALEWYSKAAEQGHVMAQYELGNLPWHDDGSSCEKWLTLAAKQGYVDAQYELGDFYNSKGRSNDCIKWWSTAAEQGYSRAQYELAHLYRYEKGDFYNAEKYYLKACEQNDCWYRDPVYDLSELYYDRGEFYLEEKNYDEAIKFWSLASEMGLIDGTDALGDFYYDIKKDYKNSEKYWLISIKQQEEGCYSSSNDRKDGHTTYRLGMLYHYIIKDHAKAAKYYLKSVEECNDEASYELEKIDNNFRL